MRFMVALEEMSGREVTSDILKGHLEDALDNAGLENVYGIEYDDQVPEADFND